MTGNKPRSGFTRFLVLATMMSALLWVVPLRAEDEQNEEKKHQLYLSLTPSWVNKSGDVEQSYLEASAAISYEFNKQDTINASFGMTGLKNSDRKIWKPSYSCSWSRKSRWGGNHVIDMSRQNQGFGGYDHFFEIGFGHEGKLWKVRGYINNVEKDVVKLNLIVLGSYFRDKLLGLDIDKSDIDAYYGLRADLKFDVALTNRIYGSQQLKWSMATNKNDRMNIQLRSQMNYDILKYLSIGTRFTLKYNQLLTSTIFNNLYGEFRFVCTIKVGFL